MINKNEQNKNRIIRRNAISSLHNNYTISQDSQDNNINKVNYTSLNKKKDI